MDAADMKLLEALSKTKAFAHLTPDEEGIKEFEKAMGGLDDFFNQPLPLEEEGAILDNIKISTKVNDLTREVTVNLQAADETAFKFIQQVAMMVEAFPIVSRIEREEFGA